MSTVLTDSQVLAWIEENLPTWTLEEGHLSRTFVTGDWRLTLLLANAIGFLAESAFHHPDLLLSYPRLTVRLQTHDAHGITEKDLELARRIEMLVTWRPAEGDALPGAPGRWIR